MNKTLLIDTIPFEVNPTLVKESLEKNNGRLIVKGVVQRANIKNQNGRIYPREILVPKVKEYMNLVKESRALGELDHPESQIVNLQNTSHLVKDLLWKGDNLVGLVEILDTPAGRILKELFKAGIKVGISSRALGSVQESKGSNIVQDDLEIIAWDFVSNPSTHGAFLSPLHESKNTEILINPYIKTNSIITEILIDMKCEYEGICVNKKISKRE